MEAVPVATCFTLCGCLWLGTHSLIKEFAADTNMCGRMKHFIKCDGEN